MPVPLTRSSQDLQASTVGASSGHSVSSTEAKQAMDLLALSHTQVEHQLYCAMMNATEGLEPRIGSFGVRRLMQLTKLNSYSTVRRGCVGLISKLSIAQNQPDDSRHEPSSSASYRVYSPQDVFDRRRTQGLLPYPPEIIEAQEHPLFWRALEKVLADGRLSRREAQVALLCLKNLSNRKIAHRLRISERTVKYHLSHIFTKLGATGRTELISWMLLSGEN
jgi:DNA-binding CsgD family transcriptional regulator